MSYLQAMVTLRSCSLMRRDRLSETETETTTKNVPCLFLPSTCQGTGPVTACDCVESKESAAYLITQGMGIMHWNKTAFIVHFGVKPQFRPVQASKKSMVEIKHAELYHSSHAFFFTFGIALELDWQ